jgi:hypothetical protein
MSGLSSTPHRRCAADTCDECGGERGVANVECSAPPSLAADARCARGDARCMLGRRSVVVRMDNAGGLSTVALCLIIAVIGPPGTVEGQSLRARGFMRFGASCTSSGCPDAAWYEGQREVGGGNFFDPESNLFRSANLPKTLNTEAEKFSAILTGGSSHMTVSDPQSVLYNVRDSGVTLEAFVRIRDTRVTLPPGNDIADIPDDKRVGGSEIRLPIMGNMMHGAASGSDYSGQGYQLACAWDKGPVCCAEAYMDAVSPNSSPDIQLVNMTAFIRR